MELNEVYYGFKLISVTDVKDMDSVLYEFKHLKSNATLAYLANEDTNCCFAIGFRTLPKDSTGVCHIIEHSVLCGSEKYPLKEPFVNLIQGSMATFLNAFTANDWTMYPFASKTPKDFDNILKVYTDAVFHPLSMKDPKPFLQEGWHLEMMDENATPCYKGVVYNEMKGAMSSVDECLAQATLKAMYKDTFYSVNSGGDPDVIPTLTYEAYKAFHKANYTPENALTYFYGKMDIMPRLKFLDEEYFSKYESHGDNIVIEEQKPFINEDYEEDYEIGEDEEEKNNTYMALSYALCSYDNVEELTAFNILSSALLGDNDSPVKKALLEAKLGEDVEVGIDDDKIRPALIINLQKTNRENKAKFRKVFLDAIRKQVGEGIDKDLLKATINRFEFKDKEMDMGRMAKGLIPAMQMMGSFNYRTPLVSHLEFSKHYDKLRKELDNGYFEKLLDKYILNSSHYVEVVLNPSKTLGKEKEEAMNKKMEELKNSLTKEEKKALVKQTKELLAYQNHKDTPKELKTLPKLTLRDIPSDISYLESRKLKVNGMEGIYHHVDTNSIAYLRVFFDLKGLNEEDLPYVSLLSRLLLNVKTSKYSVEDLNKAVRMNLGEFRFNTYISTSAEGNLLLKLKLSISALKENISFVPELMNEVLNKSRFTKKEVKTIIAQMANEYKAELIQNGMKDAVDAVRAMSSQEGAATYKMARGYQVYTFFKELSKKDDVEDVIEKLKLIYKKIFTKKNAFISLSGDEETVSSLKEMMKEVKLPRGEEVSSLQIEPLNKESTAVVIPSGVSYSAVGGNLKEIGEEYSSSLLLVAHIVEYNYFWSEIRVKGGAYGCSFTPRRNGDITFGSYRDPNVKNTYEVFKNLPSFLRNYNPSKDEFVTNVIGAAGTYDSPCSTPAFINMWDSNYLMGVSKKMKQEGFKNLLKTSAQQVRDYADLFEKLLSNNAKYTIGNDAKIRECEDLKDIKNI